MRNGRKSFHMERATAIKQKQPDSLMVVVPALAAEVPKDMQTAHFKCGSCSLEFASLADHEPFCVNCGSDNVEQQVDSEGQAEQLPEEDQLTCAICEECQTHNILSDASAKQLVVSHDGVSRIRMCCSGCGAEFSYTVPEVLAEDQGTEQQAEGQGGEQPNQQQAEGEDDLDVTDTIDIEAEGQDSQEQSAGADMGGEQPNQQQAEGEGTDQQAEGQDDQAADQDSTQQQAEPTDQEFVEMSLLKVVSGTDLSFINADNQILAMVNGVAVARLTKETAKEEHRQMFHEKAFLEAIAHNIQHVGLEKALTENFGFAPIQVAFPLKKYIGEKIQAGVSEEAKKIQTAAESMETDFIQCLSIAASGLNKGFFKGSSHVLKSMLFDELSAVGIKQPSSLIDKVFEHAGDAFFKTLIEQAKDLVSKPIEVRNAIAEAVSATNYMKVESSDSTSLGYKLEANAMHVASDDESSDQDDAPVTAGTIQAIVAESKRNGIPLFRK